MRKQDREGDGGADFALGEARKELAELRARVDELELVERKLGETARQYRLMFEHAVEGMFQTSPDGRYLAANPALARIYGYGSPDELIASVVDIASQLYADPGRRDQFVDAIGRDDFVSGFESRIRRKDGVEIWISEHVRAVRDPAGRLLYYEGTVQDISRRKDVEQRLLHDAFHDALTGLPNRALLSDRLGRMIWRAQRRGDAPFALVLLDLDRFRLVNESLGHLAGDRMLIALAARLERWVRANDFVAHVGGGQFAAVLGGVGSRGDVAWAVDALKAVIREPQIVGGQELRANASIGVAVWSAGYDRAEDLLRDAEAAMYHAKASGEGRFQIFDQAMHEAASERLRVEGALRRALAEDEIFAVYQPLVLLATGRIVGFEALARWRDPERGLLSPASFIPVAEETGLIVPLGLHMLREACLQAKRWNEAFPEIAPLSMSVNVSARQLARHDIVPTFQRVLAETGLGPELLQLEITESATMRDPEAAIERLAALRDLGLSVSLDDFGTGYASLAQLHRFPLNSLKVDRSFVAAMGPEARDTQILHAIVSLAHNLGLAVTAEGVETVEQRRRLRTLRCEHAQGFHFAKPMSAADAEHLLATAPVFMDSGDPVHDPDHT
jgi:diguanylate cyclase (GGDEF)-like protein/PAS domain S-box-containing protein